MGNLGNDGSLEAAATLVRQAVPGRKLIALVGEPQRVSADLGIKSYALGRTASELSGRNWLDSAATIAVKLSLLVRAPWRLRHASAVVVPGMGILDDFGTGPLGWPFDLAMWLLAARLMGARVVLLGIGAGPIRNKWARRLMTWAARLATYRSFRDNGSRDFVGSLGIDVSGDPVIPDITLSLPRAPEGTLGADAVTVGVGMMAYFNWAQNRQSGEEIYRAYITKMSQYVRGLLDRGLGVRLLIGEASDAMAVDDLLGSLPPDLAIRVEYDDARILQEVIEQIGKVDVVVATRYHNIVCAVHMGRPAISIGYAEKNAQLLSRVGLGEFTQMIEDLDLELLRAQTDRLIGERTRLAATVRAERDLMLRELDTEAERLAVHLSPR